MYSQATDAHQLIRSIAIPPLVQALRADIRADTNRDGLVDLTGDSDVAEKGIWTEERGALFLANIADTDRRCSIQALSGPALEDDFFDRCNDASDDILRQEKYLAPLRTVPIPDVPSTAVGTITVEDQSVAKFVRIFSNKNGTWSIVTNSTTFSSAQLRNGLKLGIDSREPRRPSRWDGRAVVKFSVHEGSSHSEDKVMLRVAPVLTHHHLQAVEQVMTTNGNATDSPFQAQFVANLSALLPELGAQDFIEPGYSSIPGPDGPISIRIHIRSGQDDRVAGRQVFEWVRGTGVGAVQSLGGSGNDLHSMGNVETIPPYELKGKKYPAGRIIIGSRNNWQHHNLPFFQAQELQDPVILDTEWLFIGHVDEFIQFLPANNERGWVIMVDDPNAGIDMFEQLITEGAGFNITVPQYTISELLKAPGFIDLNKECAKRIEANLEIVKKATRVTDGEIFRLPALLGQARFRSNETLRAGAGYPGIINGVVLNDGHYLAPNPWGPIINGTDVLADDARVRYKRAANMNVTFIDDWFSHHGYYGELHCGTNTIRKADAPWWKY
ncbi:hypothetical protein FDECE_16031 [Fusarium decemcellulare]|nr:hypothetical protein FDECE_16031 [Fusarium decemcellulare]